MKNIKKKIKGKFFIVTAIGLSVAIIIYLTLTAFSLNDSLKAKKIENRQYITLPKNMKLIYNLNNVAWDGFGKIYTVFKLKNDASKSFLEYISEWDGKKYSKVNILQRKAICEQDFKNALNCFKNIPEKYHPNWNEDFRFIQRVDYIPNFSVGKGSVNLFVGLSMIYFPNTLHLYVFEIFN